MHILYMSLYIFTCDDILVQLCIKFLTKFYCAFFSSQKYIYQPSTVVHHFKASQYRAHIYST